MVRGRRPSHWLSHYRAAGLPVAALVELVRAAPFGAGAGARAWRMTSAKRGPRGGGTQRERRPGVWEVRIPLGPDPLTGRTRHRSATVHGTSDDATWVRTQLRAERGDLGPRHCRRDR